VIVVRKRGRHLRECSPTGGNERSDEEENDNHQAESQDLRQSEGSVAEEEPEGWCKKDRQDGVTAGSRARAARLVTRKMKTARASVRGFSGVQPNTHREGAIDEKENHNHQAESQDLRQSEGSVAEEESEGWKKNLQGTVTAGSRAWAAAWSPGR
jgi:hypothetical protein